MQTTEETGALREKARDSFRKANHDTLQFVSWVIAEGRAALAKVGSQPRISALIDAFEIQARKTGTLDQITVLLAVLQWYGITYGDVQGCDELENDLCEIRQSRGVPNTRPAFVRDQSNKTGCAGSIILVSVVSAILLFHLLG